jgi:drug/metabolite transporter (DMT)-like permease
MQTTGATFWSNMVTAAALAVVCNTLLVEAVKRDDLSLLGPINSFKPVVSLVPALWLLGEVPGVLGLAGIALVVVGSYGLVGGTVVYSPASPKVRLFQRRGVQLRVAALVLSAVEAVFLKRAMAAATPTATFVGWSMLGLAFAATAVGSGVGGVAGASQMMTVRRCLLWFIGTTAATGLMQFSTLVVFRTAPVASALALFQLSSVLSVVLGHRLFGEPHVVRRLLSSVVMAVGAALITLDC